MRHPETRKACRGKAGQIAFEFLAEPVTTNPREGGKANGASG
jgi:hypothetical protein